MSKNFILPCFFVVLCFFHAHAYALYSNQADKKLDEVIEQIKILLPQIADEKKSELYFRLAESYFEKSKYAYENEYEQFDKAYQSWIDKGRKTAEPKLMDYLYQSIVWQNMALELYEKLIRQYGDYKRLDEVLYNLAFHLYESGKKSKALSYYHRLINNFLGSHYLADAYLALGEHYFTVHDLKNAYEFYEKAIHISRAKNKSSVYVYAFYKQAWCDFNEQRFQAALEKLQAVVKLSHVKENEVLSKHLFKKNVIQLKSEALNDLVRVFAELGYIEEAYHYFHSELVAENILPWMEKLAKAFQYGGKHEEEIKTYDFIQKKEKDADKILYYNLLKLKAYSKIGRRENLIALSQIITKTCQQKQHSICLEAEEITRNVGLTYHRFASDLKLQNDYELAKNLYSSYLLGFSRSSQADKIKFYLAEILWDMGEWESAVLHYEEVFKQSVDKELTSKAFVNALLTLEKMLEEEERPYFINNRLVLPKNEAKPNNEKKIGLELSDVEKHFVQIVQFYGKFLDKNGFSESEAKENRRLLYQVALIYHRHQQYEESQSYFLELVDKWPDSKESQEAMLFVLNDLELRQKWASLKEISAQWLQQEKFNLDVPFREKIKKFEEGSVFNEILTLHQNALQQVEEEKQQTFLLSIAKEFEAFAQKYPASTFVAKALYNAAQINWQIGQHELAVSIAENWLSHFDANILKEKDHELMKKNLLRLLFDAAVVYANNGQDEKALQLFSKYANPNIKKNDDRFFVFQYEMAKLYQKRNQRPLMIHACKQMHSEITNVKKPLEKTLVSEAQAFCDFQFLEEEWDFYLKVNFQVPFAQIKKQIERKEKWMKALNQKYLKIIDHKNAKWGIWSLYRAAMVQLDYVKALREMPEPKELPVEALDIFKKEVSSIAFIAEEEAITVLEKALLKARELGVDIEVTNKIQTRLSELGAK